MWSGDYARDHTPTQELELRFDSAEQGHDATELQRRLVNSPALPPMVAEPAPFYSMAPERGSGAVALPEKRYLAMMSAVKKAGTWTVSPRTVATAILGTIRLDLRQAFPPGADVDIDVPATMGQSIIIVPPGPGAGTGRGLVKPRQHGQNHFHGGIRRMPAWAHGGM